MPALRNRSARARSPIARGLLLSSFLLCAALGGAVGCSDGDMGAMGEPGAPGAPGPQGPQGQVIDDGTAVETCLECHGPDGVVPVADVSDPFDAHHVDLDPDGPQTASGYRQLEVEIVSVDVTGSAVEVVFDATDENGSAVNDLYAGDGRFALARLQAPIGPGAATTWETLRRSERFTTSGGVFAPEGGGRYRYTSVWDPTSVPVAAGDTLRLAIQLSASDLPAGNGICDFDADLATPNDCTSPVTSTRDIIPTAQCNGCHGVTPETKLAFHGGGRTDLRYCVTCHNPDLGEADMGPLTHRIHYGANLQPQEPPFEWAHVEYTRDIADCTTCHAGGGVDEANWYEVPTRSACGACHDQVNFSTGAGHGSGGVQLDDSLCADCHPAGTTATGGELPVRLVHRGVERNTRAALYRGAGNGHAIESLDWDPDADTLTVRYSVTRDGQKLDLASAPEYPASGGSGRVNLKVGWPTSDYTNEGSDTSPQPAQPLSYSGTDPSSVTNVGGNVFERVIPVPSGAFDTVSVSMEGYPATNLDDDLDGVADDPYDDALPVRSVVAYAHVEDRGSVLPRRTVVDIDRCNACHDAAGAGLSLHGNNRTGEMQACTVCHNADATDIARRPADPADAIDGKREEAVDMKRMIHQIHAGEELEDGVVIYGFGGTAHDFSDVGFIGNLENCETCHVDAGPSGSSYGALAAWQTLATTVDTGDERTDPSDDLNISPISSVCASCHDGLPARTHMLLHGASFIALDEDVR